jgi:hypothetical protein
MYRFERISERADAPLPDTARSRRFATTLEEFPVANG